MPSPIVHSAVGYAVYRFRERGSCGQASSRIGPVPIFLAATIGLSILPDLDTIPGFLTGDLSPFHGTMTHSLITGLLVAAVVGGLVRLTRRSGFATWFITALLCYESHVILDLFTVGRGVMLLWPLSVDRYLSPVSLFYGLRWSEGLISTTHLWTMLSELAFVGVAALGSRAWSRLVGRSMGHGEGRPRADGSRAIAGLAPSEAKKDLAGARHE